MKEHSYVHSHPLSSESRLFNKGPLDFRNFWSHIKHRYFNQNLTNSVGSIHQKIFSLGQQSKWVLSKIYLDIESNIEGSEAISQQGCLEEVNLNKGTHLILKIYVYFELFDSKFIFISTDFSINPTVLFKAFGFNFLGSTETIRNLKEGMTNQIKAKLLKNDVLSKKMDLIKYFENPVEEGCILDSDQTTENSEKNISGLGKEPINEVSLEINLINQILKKHSKIELLGDFLLCKLKNEKDASPKINNQFLLQYILKEVEALSLVQFAESIIHISTNQDRSKYLVTLDDTDDLPQIELNKASYDSLLKLRDTSNFILSYDKTVNTHIISVK